MSSLTLRPATPQDSEFAFLTKRAAFKGYVEQVWGWHEEQQREMHARRFRSQDFRLVNLDGVEVGIVALVRKPEWIDLDQLFLSPEHQGRGVGRRCMELLMEEARQAALPIRLGVLKVNPRARVFYERLGFSVFAETETHHRMEWFPQT